MRVLICEDSRTQAEDLKRLLERENFAVDWAPNGSIGLEMFREGNYDIVLSDVMMPELTGYELCSVIKADPRRRDTPVILLTELREPLDVIRGLECGADNFITKPYEPAYLVERLLSILANRSLRFQQKLKLGVEFMYQGRKFTLDPDKEQILDLLVSTFEEYVRSKKKQEAAQLEEIERERKSAEALEKAAAELARSNADLEQFANVAAHDLQQPLRTIAACTMWLSTEYHEKLDPEADELIATARRAADRMQRLITDLLAYAKLGAAGRASGPVDVEAALDIAIQNLEAAINESSAAITREDLPNVIGDPSQISQLFQNLLSNSIKFRGDERVEIRVSARREGAHWVFMVADRGIGIDEKFQEKVFGLFERVATPAGPPGTGIGLALCRKIVQRHGGEIWVRPRDGGGSEFSFTLPALKETAEG